MKKLLLSILFLLPIFIFSQEWIQNLPQEKLKTGELTFFEIQKTFNDYYTPLGVVNGKREVNGKLEKVPNWKQFKRWEWFWESRVNPQGKFPDNKALDMIMGLNNNKSNKSSAGNWTSMGPTTTTGGYAGIGRVNCIAFHPSNNNIFWVGTPSGGLWKTTDGGSTWTVLTDNNTVLGVSDIAIPSDYATSKTIYIATGDRDGGSMWSLGGGGNSDNSSIGVLKSTDDGATWESTGLTYAVSDKIRIGRLLIHPSNDNMLLAATSKGILKTTNGGTNWSTVYTYTRQYTGDGIIDMEFKPGDPTVIYASTKEYGYAPRILKSANTGDTWSTLKTFSTSDYRVEIAVTGNDALYIYAIVAQTNSSFSGIFKSTNGGTSFTQLVDGDDTNKAYLGYYSDGSGGNSGQGGYDLCIAASPTDKNIVLIGGVNNWKTTDGGTNWSICNMWTSYSVYNMSGAPVVHADKHTLNYRSDGTLFEGNDGGIYKTTNNGDSWTNITNGMAISQIYRLGVSQTDSNIVINGLQDNGSKMINGTTWSDVTGGDGMECLIDYTDKNTQYSTYTYGTIYRTTDIWSNKTTISDNISDADKGAWVTPYIIDKNNNSTLYVGYADVWKTTNKGDSFTKISTMNSSDKLRSMAIAPSNSNYLYVADFSHIWKTTNGGTGWTDVTGTIPVASNKITYIAVKNDDPLTLWVTMGGYDAQRVYQSTDGGSTWTNISTGLPDLPVMSIIQNKQETSKIQLYAGTDRGVYIKNGSDSWSLFSQGLPNVVVTELDIYYDQATPSKSKLRIATYGRGLWQSNLFSEATVKPDAGFTASSVSIQVGGTITFTDTSLNDPTSWAWTFAGGTPASSTERNPVITYNTAGTYDVILTATNAVGGDTVTKPAFITVNPAVTPVAGFMANNTSVFVGQTVQFTDTSENTPTSWAWTFTGGTPTSSTSQNPTVTYSSAGTYDVALTATNSAGSNSKTETGYITVEEAEDFPAPVDVNATASNHDVTLTWELPVVDTIINEGFEGTWLPTGWLIKHSTTIDGALSDPTAGAKWFHCDENSFSGGTHPEYIHSGTYSAAIGYSAPEFNWLITPEFDAATDTKLQFWIWYYSSASDKTKFHVMVYDAGTWSSLLDYGDGTANNEYSSIVEIDLSAYAGKTIKLAFVYEFNDGFQLMVDDIFVGSSVNGYKIYRNDELITTITDATTKEYSDTGLDAGNYDYYLTATYSNPDGVSDTTKHAVVDVYGTAAAQFSGTPTTGTFPLEVTFTNTSENADSFSWAFGDDNTSTEKNPVHTFAERGTYTVTLIASNAENSDTETKTDYITVTFDTVTADFTATPIEGVLPLEVTFTNSSTNATTYSWSFGDGETSTDESPVHTYSDAGNYTVALTASNADFSDTETKTAYITVNNEAVTANFTATPIEGAVPLQVTFTNSSTNAATYNWSFGDGETSTDESPVHTYTAVGNYSVRLIAINTGVADTLTKSNYITVNWPAPIADFSAVPTSGDQPLDVDFTDESENAQTWTWDFGDGQTSTEQNPSHTFANGTYSITLLVTNPSGNNSITKENYIKVGPNSLPENYKDRLKVYPNPVNDILSIELLNEDYKQVTIELFDTDGKLIKKVTPGLNEVIKQQINIDYLEAGNYVLRIKIDSDILVLNIIKE